MTSISSITSEDGSFTFLICYGISFSEVNFYVAKLWTSHFSLYTKPIRSVRHASHSPLTVCSTVVGFWCDLKRLLFFFHRLVRCYINVVLQLCPYSFALSWLFRFTFSPLSFLSFLCFYSSLIFNYRWSLNQAYDPTHQAICTSI